MLSQSFGNVATLTRKQLTGIRAEFAAHATRVRYKTWDCDLVCFVHIVAYVKVGTTHALTLRIYGNKRAELLRDNNVIAVWEKRS